MKRLSLRAPLAAALAFAASFGACAAADSDAAPVRGDNRDVAVSNGDIASCLPFGPRQFERMQRYHRCVDQARRQQLAENAPFKQASNQSK